MVDVLKMGASSLLNLQRAITTTGNNIANVNTEGYSKQTVHFGTTPTQDLGFGFVGTGSTITGIERSTNDFLTSQVQEFTASTSRYQTFLDYSSRLDNMLANSNTSISSSMQRFFGAFADVAANPSMLPERQALLGEAGNLADRIQSFYNSIQSLNDEINSELRVTVSDINSIADSISVLNRQIVKASASGTGPAPNDLLDQRDRLVKALSERIAVSTVRQENGSVNVFIGKGQSLVVGEEVTHLKLSPNSLDARLLEVGIEGLAGGGGSERFVTGGKLQGLLDFRNRVLLPAESQLGLVALGLGESINAQHRAGMDLNGDPGTNLFRPVNVSVAPAASNSGSTVPTVTLGDATEVRPSNYELNYDGSSWHLIRVSDNTSVSGSGPLVLDGISVDVSSGTAVAGDRFVFNPARSAASEFDLVVSDPRRIAAAAPVGAVTTAANAGSAQLTGLAVDPSVTPGLPLATPVTLTFDADALGAGVPGFIVSGGPGGISPLAYDPVTESTGKDLVLGTTGIDFSINGIPQDGDTFVISNNNGATGDNRNALLIGALQGQPLTNGKADTLQEQYASMVAQVGIATNQGSNSLDLETSLLQQAESYKDSVSGVNLDEEAANLLRYQQAYQASAQLVKIADELFQTLINSFR
ncbi:MAG: flagellar hook-associated protein FlgK [Gammaproteobacteria bacterium]|nr:flagellar hook-associated protein FlgK [Pseudomonadales bacterium]MCP5349020.1 flagellar hook-associated protein FlgK [Pseudomonadales bacterium]